MNVVVVDKMTCRGQCPAVSPAQRDSAITHLIDFTTDNTVVLTAFNNHAVITKITKSTVHNIIVAPACDPNTCTTSIFKLQITNGNMRGVIEMDQRVFHNGNHGTALFNWCRRPEIKNATPAVQIPLARLIQLFKNIEEIKSITGSETIVTMSGAGLDKALFKVNRCDMFVGIRPVIGPVTVDPDVTGISPALGTVTLIVKASRQFAQSATVTIIIALRKTGYF